MLRVNCRDGRTLSFNLREATSLGLWSSSQENDQFQSNITGMAVLLDGELYTLPLPRLYRKLWWSAELIRHDQNGDVLGVQLSVIADDTRATLTVYFKGPVAVRSDLQKIGKPRFIPPAR